MTPEQRAEIRARAEAATEGGWGFDGLNGNGSYYVVSDGHEYVVADGLIEEDAVFIAHARTDVPALLDALDAAEAAVERLQEERQEQLNMAREIAHADRGFVDLGVEHRASCFAALLREDRDRNAGLVRMEQQLAAAEAAAERVRAVFPGADDPCPPRTCAHVDCEVINALDGGAR